MGLGPSIKMTTLHHFRCPVTQTLLRDDSVEFSGIIVDGVSERCEDKLYTAKRTAEIAKAMQVDGALVAIDGWGNHHVDFVSVIEELGKRGIPSVGLSYIGEQGRLVCDNPYVDVIVDFNKCSEGYESCVVGENNLTAFDAYKALELLKSRLRRQEKTKPTGRPAVENFPERVTGQLIKKYVAIKKVVEGKHTSYQDGILTVDPNVIKSFCDQEPRIKDAKIHIISPGDTEHFVNSNLDFSPVAVKAKGEPGEGITHVFSGITVMLTGVEEVSGFQPSNIGSSEGILRKQVCFNQAGTPSEKDYLIHVDVTFEEGEGRTAQGIHAAHRLAENCIQPLREILKTAVVFENEEIIRNRVRPGKKKIILVKIVSGLGNMYDTVLFPEQPGGVIGGRNMMDTGNLPYVLTPTQCLDGMIHSLL